MPKNYALLVIIFLSINLKVNAQTYEVPKDYSFKIKDDYIKYEPEIIKTIDWLEQTPWNEQTDKRDEAKAFFLKWIEGTPTFTIAITDEVAKLSKNNGELFGSYMYGYTKYAILNKESFDINKAKIAGLKEIIAKYTNEPGHKKNSEVEKLIKIDKEGNLAIWVTTDFNKN